MSDLKAIDIEEFMGFIEKTTKKGKGYVWDFSDYKFKSFVEECTGSNIDDEKYKDDEEGNSKAKRLRRYIKNEENIKAKQLINGLLDYGTKKGFLLKSYIPKIKKIIKELEKNEKTLEINSNTVKNKKEEEVLLKHIKERLSKGEYEFAIDRLHTLLKYKFEAIFKEIGKSIQGERLDSITGELNNILRENETFKESTTFSILTATKKIMKSFDDARNHKTYAHANSIMKKNEAEFLCTYIVDYYNFINKIEYKKIKIGK